MFWKPNLHAELKFHKEKALFEVRQDLKYIEAFKKDMLEYNEAPARRKMAQLKKKDERTDAEEQELQAILDTLAESKAVKNEWEKSKKLEEDLVNYISLL